MVFFLANSGLVTRTKMFALINKILDWFKSLFWKEEMELTLVGLQYSGKTTFVNVIAVSPSSNARYPWSNSNHAYVCVIFQSGQFSEDMIPTVGFNMRKVTKGNVTIKIWDIGGQPRFRSMWERYCRGVSAIVWVYHYHLPTNSNFTLLNLVEIYSSCYR